MSSARANKNKPTLSENVFFANQDMFILAGKPLLGRVQVERTKSSDTKKDVYPQENGELVSLLFNKPDQLS